MRCTISYHHFRRIYRRCLCARFTYAALSLYISQKYRPQIHHSISPCSSFFQAIHPPQHGPKIMNEQKNTKLCQIYSHISSYKWVYFSITPGPFPVTPQLQQLRSCSSFTISELAGQWVSYPCVLWLLHIPLRSNSTTKRLLQKNTTACQRGTAGGGAPSRASWFGKWEAHDQNTPSFTCYIAIYPPYNRVYFSITRTK